VATDCHLRAFVLLTVLLVVPLVVLPAVLLVVPSAGAGSRCGRTSRPG
jgi:hypothetical protein